ncbi:hypothetical protein [Hymenobacter metallilatus]|uniref:RHS repeat protein n=1 Tax=Hymenobacter metallilatus TaxID=2493666 RepID=A0A428JU88_9BACT|nr:hypothetical protein [Hymenobacter metallilatus]RSK37606.1 hypothetical protein EI290_02880 [Hymenobacter metallilatus]
MFTNFLIPLLLLFTDKSSPTHTVATSESVDYAQVPDDLFIGQRLLLGSMSMADIRRRHIKTIRKKTVGEDYTEWSIEQFDEQGHTTYRRNWHQRLHQPGSGYSQFFVCKYAADGKLLAVSSVADSLQNRVIRRYAYRYTNRGRLKTAGNYRLTYYLDGLLCSVTDGSGTERYFYNPQGQLIQIKFGVEPGVLVCGNTTDEWQGEYNADHLLTRETHIGFEGHTYQLTYNAAGQLTRRTSSDPTWTYACTYTYQTGLIAHTTETYSGRAYGQEVTRNTSYEYERY